MGNVFPLFHLSIATLQEIYQIIPKNSIQAETEIVTPIWEQACVPSYIPIGYGCQTQLKGLTQGIITRQSQDVKHRHQQYCCAMHAPANSKAVSYTHLTLPTN
eukprot:14975310-Ditylum_brightwellii.AAC.1